MSRWWWGALAIAFGSCHGGAAAPTMRFTSQKELDRLHALANEAESRGESALAAVVHDRHLAPRELDAFVDRGVVVTSTPGPTGLLAGEEIGIVAAAQDRPAQLVFTSAEDCVAWDAHACRCINATHRFFTAEDGHPVVVRMRPRPVFHAVAVPHCAMGCGPPQARFDWSRRFEGAPILGAVAPASLEVIDAPYDYDVVIETCERPRWRM